MKSKPVMNFKNKDWDKFIGLLDGRAGCNVRRFKGKLIWKCAGNNDKSLAIGILRTYFPKVDVTKSLKFFEKHGGYCDCEILMNCDYDKRRREEK